MLLDTPSADIGWKAAPFNLADPEGKHFSFDSLMDENGLVVAFICNHCPYVQAIVERLVTDANTLQRDGVNFVAIMSNDYRYVPSDSPKNMAYFAKHHNFTFPYLVDEDQSVGKAYGAVCTPDFFGFNSAGELQYRGRLDNARMSNASNRTRELVEAMQLIAKTGRGPETQLPSIGCSIKWS
jgi:peroxiredoxin